MRGRPWTLRCRVRFLLMMAWRIVILYVRTYVRNKVSGKFSDALVPSPMLLSCSSLPSPVAPPPRVSSSPCPYTYASCLGSSEGAGHASFST